MGLSPGRATACWRGSLCQYAVCEGRLVLDDLQLSLMLPDARGEHLVGGAGPLINGVRPSFNSQASPPLNNRSAWLNLDVPFSGGLLAAAGLVEEHYIHFGFQPAWQYQTVMELLFEDGAVSQIRDVSAGVAALRAALALAPLLPNARSGEDSLRAWVASIFRLHYNL